jgi:curved DNA-binding protein CbpA
MPAALKNPYAVLGLLPSADLDAVKRRYRTLARELHPDVAGDTDEAHAAMVEVNEAYAILTDAEKRDRLNWNPNNDRWADFFRGHYGNIYSSFLGFYKSQWCHQCGRELHEDDVGKFMNFTRRADALYCSNACRQKAYRERKKAQKAARGRLEGGNPR